MTNLQALLTTEKVSKTLDPWVGAENSWVKALAPVTIGRVGENLYLKACGGRRLGNNRSGYDIEHDARRVECKLSTRSYSGNNAYLWNQVRPQDPYTHLWLVAIDVSSVQAFLIPKLSVPAGALYKQHGRKKGAENTYAIKTSSAEAIPAWLRKFTFV